MPDYRRNRVPGGTYFFTVNLQDRQSDLLTAEIEALRSAVRKIRTRRPCYIDAWVVLPEPSTPSSVMNIPCAITRQDTSG